MGYVMYNPLYQNKPTNQPTNQPTNHPNQPPNPEVFVGCSLLRVSGVDPTSAFSFRSMAGRKRKPRMFRAARNWKRCRKPKRGKTGGERGNGMSSNTTSNLDISDTQNTYIVYGIFIHLHLINKMYR